MKCPHCRLHISLFSKSLNQFGKSRTCPHCHQGVRLSINVKLFTVLFIPLFCLGLFLKSFFLNIALDGSLVTGVIAVLLLLLSMQLKPD